MNSPCPNPTLCGSCSLSHLPYDQQLAQKIEGIQTALGELARCEAIVPSPQTLRYRNRMDFVIDFKGSVGLRQKGKWWSVIDGHCCFLGDDPIESRFHPMRTWAQSCGLTFFDRKKHHGLLRYGVIRSTLSGDAMVTIVTSAPSSPEEELSAQEALFKLNEILKPKTLIWSINHTTGDVSFGDEDRVLVGDGVLVEEIYGTKFRVSPHAFFQTNSYASPLLVEEVAKCIPDVGGKKFLDLYCGTGFFALTVGKLAKEIIGVELNPQAVVDARENAKLNNIAATFHDAKTEKFNWGELNGEIVLIDPPRSGLHPDTLKDIMTYKPQTLVYVSCNYPRFADELKTLKDIYKIDRCTAVDMFPHTPHVELVTSLSIR
jgi:tRNA (uracil-5-)-methyltransferase